MIADILREDVCLAVHAGPDLLLQLHVGNAAPAQRLAAPCMVIRPGVTERDTTITLTAAPWNSCATPRILALPWAENITGEAVIASDQGPVCSRNGDVWYLNANLAAVYGREALHHENAASNVQAILSAHLVMRAVLSQLVTLPDKTCRAVSLITIDAEDQQRYFINAEGRCSNIRGRPDADMQFTNACRTIMDRCEAAGLKAVFMVTGDELDPAFVDAFGDRLIGLDDNRRVLDEMTARGHDVACHGFDHEWWIARGRSAITPMTMWQKLRYFFQTSGDVRTLFGLARFLLVYGSRILKARAATRARGRTIGEPFTYEDMRQDFHRWMQSVGFRGDRLFIRYPGYVRSVATVHYLDDRYAWTVDSSDLYELEDGLPAFPYSLLTVRDGVLRRTRVLEIPCLWIDKLMRTPDAAKVGADLARLARLAAIPGSVLSFITHTKVLGATWGHCHVYLHDPLKGMALPASRDAWEAFATFLRTQTRSSNWRDLQRELRGAVA
jgi:predicted deacetylase